MPLHKEPLTQALRNVTDERWRAHQNNVIKTPLSRYLAPSGGDLPQQGRFTPITPPSTASRPVTGINSPSSGRIYPGTCRVLELKDGGISGNGGSPPVQQVTGAWKRAIPTAMHGSPYLREDEQPNPRSMTTAVATFTPTGHIKVELKTDGVGLDLATPTKKRILNAATVVDSSSPESPGTPASGHAKRYSAVPSAADLRTPTPRRKKAAKRILSDSECDDSPSFQQAQTPIPPRRSAATTAKTRVDGSLVTITQGFIDLLSASETKSLDINKVAIRLGIPKRRIYDITNALEGIGFLRKGVKNMVHWTGVNADHINPDHQTIEHDVGALKGQQRSLDHLIKSAKDQFDKIVRVEGHRLWVTHEDLVVASKATSEQERLLMPVHAPVGTAIESSNAPEDYRVYLKSTDGPITVTLLSESIVSAQKAEQDLMEDMKPVIAEQHDLKPAELENMAMPTASSAAMASFAVPSTSATALYSDPSFGAPKIENSGNRDELPSSLLDSPTTNLLRLLDSPIKGFESDWRRPHSGNGIAGQGINSTLANTGTSPSDPVDWIDSLPLELGECDYNFVMDGTEGLGNLFDFF